MKTQGLNIFIVDQNKTAGDELKKHLLEKFGKGIIITTFTDGKSCLEEVESDTHLVILNGTPDDRESLAILKSIKEANHDTEVVILSDHRDIEMAVESFRAGAKTVILKDEEAETKVSNLVKTFFMAPIKIIVKELGLSQRLAVFLMSFLTVGVIVLIAFLIKRHSP